MKILSTLFCLLISFSSFASTKKEQCQNQLRKLGYFQYKNQYAKNFHIFYNGQNIFWELEGQWYSRGPNVPSDVCAGVINIKKSNRIILMSSTLLEVFRELNLTKNIVGVGEKKFIFNSRDKLESATDLGHTPNPETIISLRPDLFIGYYSPVLGAFYEKVKKLGVPVVFINDYQQQHPLGRAEQRVILGAFLGQFQHAKDLFLKIVNNYQKYKNLVQNKRNILLGSLAPSGAWKRINPHSDFFQVVRDAGGVDVFSSTSFLNVSAEKVLSEVKNIEHWLPQVAYASIDDLKKESNFLNILVNSSDFDISTYGKRINQNGGSEFWDVAMMRPDLLLFDLIQVFNTSVSADPKLARWYKVLR